eukprot:6185395-Amphidinium_carterae.1
MSPSCFGGSSHKSAKRKETAFVSCAHAASTLCMVLGFECTWSFAAVHSAAPSTLRLRSHLLRTASWI